MKRFIEGEDRGKGTLLPELLDEAALLEKGLTVTTGRDRPWIQPVDATSLLNRSAGVWYSKVFLGRSFNLRATSLS